MALGFTMIVTFMVLIMTKRLSPMVALSLIPVAFALIAGFPVDAVGKMMFDGVKTLAPTGIMLMFAILYFGVMIDAGMFDPAIRTIVRLVGADPLKVVVGTAVLAAVVSLDGDGSTTYMITVAAMLPLYQRLRMSALNLTCVTMLAGGVMNMTPWGGPLWPELRGVARALIREGFIASSAVAHADYRRWQPPRVVFRHGDLEVLSDWSCRRVGSAAAPSLAEVSGALDAMKAAGG
jgi:Mg2+/citrate symporter